LFGHQAIAIENAALGRNSLPFGGAASDRCTCGQTISAVFASCPNMLMVGEA
jgi:hypothetical protein